MIDLCLDSALFSRVATVISRSLARELERDIRQRHTLDEEGM